MFSKHNFCFQSLKRVEKIIYLLNYFQTYINVKLIYEKGGHTNTTHIQRYFSLRILLTCKQNIWLHPRWLLLSWFDLFGTSICFAQCNCVFFTYANGGFL
jgi:hypothetical protein